MFDMCGDVLSRGITVEIGRRKRTGHTHINTETFALTPRGNCNISRSAARVLAFTDDASLFHDRAQGAFTCNLVDEIANPVMTDNEVPIRGAADSVVAINI